MKDVLKVKPPEKAKAEKKPSKMKFIAVSTDNEEQPLPPKSEYSRDGSFRCSQRGCEQRYWFYAPKSIPEDIVEKYRALARQMCGQTHSLGHSATFEVPLDPSLIAK